MMDIESFAKVCRDHFGRAARDLSDIAAKEKVSEIDLASAKVALLIELAALLAVNQSCILDNFLNICENAFHDAWGKIQKAPKPLNG